MNNLQCYDEITDHTIHSVYQIWSHKQLSNSEQVQVIGKKSLHTILRTDIFYRGQPGYQIVEIIAGDGWEGAE